MNRQIRRCVKCGAPLTYQEIRAAGPFPCPICHAQLQAPNSYGHWITLGNLLFSAIVFLLLGLRGFHLFFAVLLVWLPVEYVALNMVKYSIPPKIELYLPKDATLRLRDGPRP